MVQTIGCTQCGKENMLSINFKFTSEVSTCKQCHKIHAIDWTYYFCDLNCFMKWIKENKIAQKGLPCQSCQACDEHKECRRCKGKGRVKKTKTDFKKVDIPENVEYYVIDNNTGCPITVKGK